MRSALQYEDNDHPVSAYQIDSENRMPAFYPEELSNWSKGTWSTLPNPVFGVSHDTRTLKPLNLYVAIKGDRFDGHRFVQEAFERGASAALVDRGFAESYTGTGALLVVEDTFIALQNLARGYRKLLYAEMITITGSVGKTTVKELLAAVLGTIGPVTRTPGNWNNHIGVPLSLLSMDTKSIFGIFEIGMNQPGDLAPLCTMLRPHWGVMTPVGAAHTEAFENVDGIVREKAVMLESLPVDGVAILNLDDTYFQEFNEAAPERVVTVSMSEEADYHGTYDPGTGQLVVADRKDGSSHSYEMPLPTEFFVKDALLAVAMGREHGIPHEKIAQAIMSYSPPSMRWNQMDMKGVSFINDAYNANPMSMKASLLALSQMMVRGKKFAVLGGMLELGALETEEHLALGRTVAHGGIDGLIAVGSLAQGIAAGAREAGMEQIIECDDTRAAATAVRAVAKAGDTVLLKASRAQRMEEVLETFLSFH